jgi:hypothetical protein
MHGTLEILDGKEPRMAFGITITDVGSGGVGLIAGGNLAIGSKVRLSIQNGVLEGVVVHCHPEIGHYTAGISVAHDSGVLARLQWMASLSPAGHAPAARLRGSASR